MFHWMSEHIVRRTAERMIHWVLERIAYRIEGPDSYVSLDE